MGLITSAIEAIKQLWSVGHFFLPKNYKKMTWNTTISTNFDF